MEDIDWTSTGRAFQGLPTWSRKMWLSKHVTGFGPSAKTMHRRREWKTNLCPLCKNEVEDSQHVILCSDPQVQTLWEKALVSLNQFLQEQHTCPDLRKAIITGLTHWQLGTTSPYNSLSAKIQTLIEQQSQHSWNTFFNGFPS